MDDQIDKLVERVKAKNPERVLLQVPEGLRLKAIRIAQALEKAGIETAVSAEPCFGACDLCEPGKLECDMLVHIGHNKLIDSGDNVLYFPWEIETDISNVDISEIKEKRIGLLASVQHLGMLSSVAEALKKIGKEPVIGGQILGCRTQNAEKIADKVDAFLVIGSGMFHALGVKGRVYVLDLEKNKAELVNQALLEKKRYAKISKAQDAKSFGILVSTKPGQMNMEKAREIKKQLEERDKKAFILIMDNITEEKLLGLKLDAFINTACPRLSDDLPITIINADDINEVFK